MDDRRFYLAYGSNLNLEQMSRRCPDATLYGIGVIKGYELVFRSSMSGAYLTIEKNPDSEVNVGIFQVSRRDIKALDRYEGFPSLYYKKNFDIPMIVDGEPERTRIKGFAYIMDEDRPLGKPSSRYVETCRLGYQDMGFDLNNLEDAIYNTQRRIENGERN